jgi:O-antigen/teichoic acid export membrane protein
MTANGQNRDILQRESSERGPYFSGGLIARNTIYNLIGQILPMLVALATIPIIIRGLGVDRYGILTLAWMVIGYFSLFDMGLGRATTKFVAEYLAAGHTEQVTRLIWASMIMLLGLGILGAIIAFLLTPWLVSNVFNIPPGLTGESRYSFYILACAVPIILGTAGARGVLEAQQRFDLVNIVKFPSYTAAFVTPLLVLPFTNDLFPIVAVLISCRLAAFVAYLYFCVKLLPQLSRPQIPTFSLIKRLLRYSGWLMISNIIWPMMVYLDRFIIGAVLTMQAVAYYVTPYELVAKLLILSGSLLGVIFPVFSAYSTGQFNRLIPLHEKAVRYLLLILTPAAALIIGMAHPFLKIWLGGDFPLQSAPIMQLLAVGILINAVSQVPSSALQAMGRPDITAKLHMIELPLYLILVWAMIHSWGIMGAALAWVLRVIFDTAMLFILFYRKTPSIIEQPAVAKKKVILWTAVFLGIAFLISLLTNPYLKIAALSGMMSVMLLAGWRLFLVGEERSYLKGLADRLSHREFYKPK